MNASAHILVVDDDRETATLVSRYLRANGCRVSTARDGRSMDAALADSRLDLIVLDIMLPGEDGLSLCRRLRTRSQIPVSMVTARGAEVDRIVGLELGADDYLPKPFNPRELLARIHAVLRRSAFSVPARPETKIRYLRFRGWELDLVHRRLTDPAGTHVTITGAEFDLLQSFCERPGRALSRDQLLDLTQGRAPGPYERSIDILVSRLRRKIERDPHEPEMIRTLRSEGYLFTPEVARA